MIGAADAERAIDLGLGVFKRDLPYMTPEQFGAVGDYDYLTGLGTDNTAALQRMFNAARLTGLKIQIGASKKYLTGTLYLNYDAVNNPVYPDSRPGRIAIEGAGTGIATGSQEVPGCSFVHKDGVAGPLISCVGVFSILAPGGMGGQICIDRVNFVGGTLTTDVLYYEACQGQISLSNSTIKVVNRAGNGITENTTWETVLTNILIRGPARGLGPNEVGYDPAQLATGIGLNIKDNGSGGQVNMKLYNNVNSYKMGYGVRVGRRASSGIFGPLIFIGGQTSLTDNEGFWIDGGVYSLTAIGFQIEQSSKAGLRIDSNGASDIPRQILWEGGYFTHCGKAEDGTVDSFAINVVDGTGVHLNRPMFQNVRSGITFDRTKAKNLRITLPEFRTVTAWGAASGTCIDAYGGALPLAMGIDLDGISVVNGCATVISANAKEAFAVAAAGDQISVSSGTATPNLSLGSSTGARSAKNLNLNNGSATTITNILGGELFQRLLITCSNTNTTVAANSTIFLDDGRAWVPADSKATLLLEYDGTIWKEIARSRDVKSYEPRIRGSSAVAVPLTGSTAETTLATIDIGAGLLGLDGIIDVDMVLSWTNSANNKTIKAKYGGAIFSQNVVTTTASGRFQAALQNRDSAASQVSAAASNPGSGTNSSAVVTLTIDSSVAQTLTITGQLALGTETLTLERYTVRTVSGRKT